MGIIEKRNFRKKMRKLKLQLIPTTMRLMGNKRNIIFMLFIMWKTYAQSKSFPKKINSVKI